VISKLSKSSLKKSIYRAFQECRAKTLVIFERMDEATFCCQVHPDFSPVGWHLGHIAYTESLWLLERGAGKPCLFPQYRKLFAADGLPKSERVQLPNLEEIRDYLDTVRTKVLDYLEVADLKEQERLLRFLLQHESQHCETVSFILEMCKRESEGQGDSLETPWRQGGQGRQESNFSSLSPPSLPLSPSPPPLTEMIEIPTGEFEMGNSSIDALDNERPVHRVYLETYSIDRYPVTCGQYRAFMEAGGYENPRFWSQSGWEWLQNEQVTQPLYWYDDPAMDNHPVCGVNWYEADAYSRFVGKRLPTEAEWEKAASWNAQTNFQHIYPWGDDEVTNQSIAKYCNCDRVASLKKNRLIYNTTPVNAYSAGQSAYGMYDALGNVWEWTNSWFDGYDGFQSYPYVGYSQVYFDQQHRVLKGGSWATFHHALRSSFRNWYYPNVRQIFAGFRCAV
jgi:gamma-glutamyl hercynylcysteine S-oxide synthase